MLQFKFVVHVFSSLSLLCSSYILISSLSLFLSFFLSFSLSVCAYSAAEDVAELNEMFDEARAEKGLPAIGPPQAVRFIYTCMHVLCFTLCMHFFLLFHSSLPVFTFHSIISLYFLSYISLNPPHMLYVSLPHLSLISYLSLARMARVSARTRQEERAPRRRSLIPVKQQ